MANIPIPVTVPPPLVPVLGLVLLAQNRFTEAFSDSQLVIIVATIIIAAATQLLSTLWKIWVRARRLFERWVDMKFDGWEAQIDGDADDMGTDVFPTALDDAPATDAEEADPE